MLAGNSTANVRLVGISTERLFTIIITIAKVTHLLKSVSILHKSDRPDLFYGLSATLNRAGCVTKKKERNIRLKAEVVFKYYY